MTGKGYDGLDIGKGDDASLVFFNIVMGVYNDDEKAKVYRNLETYCALDTEGMIWIIDALAKIAI